MPKATGAGGEIFLAGGHVTVEQLEAMLNTIPLEITFVDTDNINRYFNEGSKVFKRPGMALDREVFSCHPPKIEQQVRRIIGELKIIEILTSYIVGRNIFVYDGDGIL